MTSLLPFPEEDKIQDRKHVVLVDLATGERLIVKALPVMIGRKGVPTSDRDYETEILYLTDSTISRFHAELTTNMGQYFLMDLSSRNGTFVNGERLPPNERREVVSGDTVRFGRVNFRFIIPPCEQEAAFPKNEEPAYYLPDEIKRTPANDEVSVYIKWPKKRGLFSRLFRKNEHNNARPVEEIRHDPIEDDARYKHIFQEVDAEIDERYPAETYLLGACHGIWREKKRILKERYGIDWKTPDEMNPGVNFD